MDPAGELIFPENCTVYSVHSLEKNARDRQKKLDLSDVTHCCFCQVLNNRRPLMEGRRPHHRSPSPRFRR